MLKKGDNIRLSIEDIHYDGCGVGTWNGQKIFVEEAVTGDELEAEIIYIRAKQPFAKISNLITASPHRTSPPCAHFGRCGGCVWQHVDTDLQKNHRVQSLRQLFHAAGLEWDAPIETVFVAPYHYRRRARLSVRYDAKKDQVYVGFRERQGRYVADVRNCPILVEPEWPERLRALFFSLSIRAEIPQVDYARGDHMSVLVVRMLRVPTREDVALLRDFVDRYSVRMALQLSRSQRLIEIKGSVDEMMDAIHALFEGTHPGDVCELDYEVGRCVMSVGSFDFVQVNGPVSSWMLDHAVAYLDLKKTDRVLDLFCGLGAFAFNVAPHVAWVKGMELSEEMVGRATRYAQAHNMPHVFFEVSNLFDRPQQVPPCDVLIVDPPRSGMEHLPIWAERTGADRLLYVSCHAATLVRDISGLVHQNLFQIERVVVMDMFAQTKHMEVMVLLRRVSVGGA